MSDAALTPDEIRSLLRECVTVVRPGETLIVQVSQDWTPNQMRDMQQALNWQDETGKGYWPFRVLVVPAGSLGVGEAPPVRHACPPKDGENLGVMPCCGKLPWEVPGDEKITLNPELVTCGAVR